MGPLPPSFRKGSPECEHFFSLQTRSKITMPFIDCCVRASNSLIRSIKSLLDNQVTRLFGLECAGTCNTSISLVQCCQSSLATCCRTHHGSRKSVEKLITESKSNEAGIPWTGCTLRPPTTSVATEAVVGSNYGHNYIARGPRSDKVLEIICESSQLGSTVCE